MSWRNKYPIVKDMIPEYVIGDELTIIGRTPLKGERCTVVSIWPNQKCVVYTVMRSNGRETDVNQTMLRRNDE